MQKYIDRALLVAILLVLVFSVFAGGAKKIGAFDPATDTNFTNNVIVGGTLSVTGATSITGNISSAGSITTGNFFQGGSVADISTTSATYTLSASDVCGSSYIKVTPLGAITTVTLPATTTLTATCLTSVGQFKDISYQSTGTSTVIAAGAGETLGYSSSTTVAAGKHGLLRLIRDSATTVDVYLVNIPN